MTPRDILTQFHDDHPKAAVATVGAIAVSIFLAILLLLYNYGPDSNNRKQTARQLGATDSVVSSTTSPTTTSSSPFSNVTTTTMGQYQLEYPESNLLTADQLAQTYNLDNSALNRATYRQAVEVAKRFVEIDVTGGKPGEFQYYYDASHDAPYGWVSNYQFSYATARRLADGSTVAYVWFSGTNSSTKIPIVQARYGVLLQADNTGAIKVLPNPGFLKGEGMGVEVVE